MLLDERVSESDGAVDQEFTMKGMGGHGADDSVPCGRRRRRAREGNGDKRKRHLSRLQPWTTGRFRLSPFPPLAGPALPGRQGTPLWFSMFPMVILLSEKETRT